MHWRSYKNIWMLLKAPGTKPGRAKHKAGLHIISTECMATTNQLFNTERQLSIAEEIKDLTFEADALHGLRNIHRRVGDYDKAMEYLEQGLIALSELEAIVEQADTYAIMGELLLARGGREKEAIEILQIASGILETHGPKEFCGLSKTLCNLGEAYMRIKAWDDAITTLEKSISISASIEFELTRNGLQSDANQILGRTYLEQYYIDESMVGVPEKRGEVIGKASFCCQVAINLRRMSAEFFMQSYF